MELAALQSEASIAAARLQLRLAAVGAITWMVYDTVLSLGDEIQSIWKTRMSWVMWVYVFIRYLPIVHSVLVVFVKAAMTHTPSACRAWMIYELVFVEVLTLSVEIILTLRIYILYNHRKWILCSVVFAFVAEVVGMVVILAVVVPSQRLTPDCLIAAAPNTFMAYWLTSLAFESFLFALTLLKFFQHATGQFGQQPVLYIFFRDGSWAFSMIFAVLVMNALIYKLAHGPSAGLGYIWALAVMSFCGSHVLLNIRRLGVPDGEEDNATLTTMSFRTWNHGMSTTPGRRSHTSTHEDATLVIEMDNLTGTESP